MESARKRAHCKGDGQSGAEPPEPAQEPEFGTVTVLTKEEFVSVEQVFRGGVPVVVRGCIVDWPAMQWSPKYIATSEVMYVLSILSTERKDGPNEDHVCGAPAAGYQQRAVGERLCVRGRAAQPSCGVGSPSAGSQHGMLVLVCALLLTQPAAVCRWRACLHGT